MSKLKKMVIYIVICQGLETWSLVNLTVNRRRTRLELVLRLVFVHDYSIYETTTFWWCNWYRIMEAKKARSIYQGNRIDLSLKLLYKRPPACNFIRFSLQVQVDRWICSLISTEKTNNKHEYSYFNIFLCVTILLIRTSAPI